MYVPGKLASGNEIFFERDNFTNNDGSWYPIQYRPLPASFSIVKTNLPFTYRVSPKRCDLSHAGNKMGSSFLKRGQVQRAGRPARA